MHAAAHPVSRLSAEDLLHRAIADAGFTFVHAPAMRALLEQCGSLADWAEFADSWNRLGPDPYIARTGRARRRRHAVFDIDAGGRVSRAADRPHFQALDYNALQGGIERRFDPIESGVAGSATLRAILAFAYALFARLAGATSAWSVEVHQFRIEALPDHAGEPTPEGRHRDGVDYVLVLLIDRQNIASGTTSIHRIAPMADARGKRRPVSSTPSNSPQVGPAGDDVSPQAPEIGSFTLTTPLDAALVDDHRVLHGVTAVTPVDPTQPANRDVLVVTFRRA